MINRKYYNLDYGMDHLNTSVQIIGWVSKRRNFGDLVFMDIRDRTGIMQVVFQDAQLPLAKDLKNEYLVNIWGQLVERQDPNPKLPTGMLEVIVSTCEVITKAKQTPMIVADKTDALEELRLKYRYLDLRRPIMQHNLMVRAKIVKAMRDYLDEQGFIDVETPLLTKSTPEGSREYLVPSRVHPGEFYALAQSPQIFKQMLMIAGFERYYQISRCFRDEDLRADRQLDFTQVDIEASFMDSDHLFSHMEAMLQDVFQQALNQELALPFKRMSFKKAMDNYGTDKPDLRFEMQLQDATEIFKAVDFELFKDIISEGGVVKVLVVNQAQALTRRKVDELTALVKKHHARSLVVLKYVNGELTGSIRKFLSDIQAQQIIDQFKLVDNDAILLVGDQWEPACIGAGALRSHFGKQLFEFDADHFEFVWVVDMPMFEYVASEERLVARHHPFTSPQSQYVDSLRSKPLEALANAYDLVCNGFEIAGGSQRIYDPELQKEVFELIGFSQADIEKRFGFFVEAFDYGTPPHGGIAFGLDRLAMVLTHAESLRDVIAFPKNAAARCPLTGAPSTITSAQLAELSLKVAAKDKET
ncbi:MAG: aspartate--tRNA ligase [Erysipelothrix sp.]|nr:aspartate--tRNA ligase [Erysipelothrix sp.]